MKRIFFAGFLSAFLFFLAGWLTGEEVLTFICGGVGFAALFISGLFSGAFISGSQFRANTSTETKEERKKRTRLMSAFALAGAPHFAAAIILTMFFKRSGKSLTIGKKIINLYRFKIWRSLFHKKKCPFHTPESS
ncbi:hypothetical protein FZC84_00395 [Rossellomorea vietnamensis]|uniref:Uncharacterized protein n=1 Tax=Rossellomorea vietnamensis TaxID=218284 RepID=A0A5D4MH10_9BACI|nr:MULTISPECIES: DUF5316 domain-containing protein [Bacillaceae]TYS01165.1 hypothetical protein FZC84_00395 [Rossellomorea vietnamensis]